MTKIEVLTPGLPRRGDAAGQGDRRAARRLQPQRRGGAAPVPGGAPRLDVGALQARAAQRQGVRRRRGDDQVRADGGARRVLRGDGGRAGPAAREPRPGAHRRPVPAPHRAPPADRALLAPRRVQGAGDRGLRAGLRPRRGRPAGALQLPRRPARRPVRAGRRARCGSPRHEPAPSPRAGRARRAGGGAHRRARRAGRRGRRLVGLQRRRRGRRRRRRRQRLCAVHPHPPAHRHRGARPRARRCSSSSGSAFLYWFVTRGLPKLQAWWAERAAQRSGGRQKTSKRERRVELAAAEAADEDPDFAPRARPRRRPRAVPGHREGMGQRRPARHARPRGARSPGRVGAAAGRLRRTAAGTTTSSRSASRWSSTSASRAPATPPPTASWSRSTPGSRTTSSTATAATSSAPGACRRSPAIREFWTLQKRGGRWILASIEQGGEGKHALDEEIVATAWGDETGMRDEALIEGAVADQVPEGTKVAEVADLQYDGDAHAAAMDLSLADGRFAPDVLEVAARRAVAGLGPGDRRRRRAAGRDRHAGGQARAAVRRRHQRRRATGRARPRRSTASASSASTPPPSRPR